MNSKLQERLERKERKKYGDIYYDTIPSEKPLKLNENKIITKPNPYVNNPLRTNNKNNRKLSSADITIMPDTLEHREHVGHSKNGIEVICCF